MNEVLRFIGNIITWTFDTLLVPAGQMPNILFIIIGFVGMFLWLKMQGDYNRKAKQNGTIK